MQKVKEDFIIFNNYILKTNVLQKIENIKNLKPYIMDKSSLSYALNFIERKYKYPSVKRIIEDINLENIIFVNFPEDILVPSILPCWLRNDPYDDTNFIAVVNVNIFKEFRNLFKREKEAISNEISSKQLEYNENIPLLFYLSQVAEIIRDFKMNNTFYKTNNTVVVNSASLYSSLFLKILEKNHSISLNKGEVSNIRNYIIYFFCKNMLEFDDKKKTFKVIDSVNILNGTDSFESKEINENNFRNIKVFLEFLSSNFSSLKELTFRKFLEGWITLYGTDTLLGLEHFNYFLAIIVGGTSMGSKLIKSFFIETVGTSQVLEKIYTNMFKG